MVLWGIMLMAMVIIGLIAYVRTGVGDDISANKEFHARMMAESGLVVGRHAQVGPYDPLLRQQLSQSRGYEVEVTTEGGRIAINQIAANSDIKEYCQRLFELWRLDAAQAATAADSLKDWVDPDDKVSVHGAEEEFYTIRGSPDYPKNAPFQHIDEMLLVRGMEEVSRRKSNWRDSFTLYGSGLIDVNEASAEMLEIVCQVPPDQAQRVVLERFGPDGVRGTKDDTPLTSFRPVREALSLNRDEFAKIVGRLTLKHPIRRIMSRGRAGDFVKTLLAIEGAGINLIREEDRNAVTWEKD